MLPSLVDRDDLILANGRLLTGVVTLNQLAGPALGALLFAGGTAWPFIGQAVLVGLGAVMITRIALPARPAASVAPRLRTEMMEGCRWAVRHPGVRTLVLTISIFNITFGAAWSVLVLYTEERLHLGLALTTDAALAMAIMVVFGAHAFVWGATSPTASGLPARSGSSSPGPACSCCSCGVSSRIAHDDFPPVAAGSSSSATPGPR